MNARILAAAIAAFALPACHHDAAAPAGPDLPPGLAADPEWLTFQCVKPGCDTKLQLTVSQVGTRRIAVKRLVLSDEKRTDFVIETDQKPPFVVPSSFVMSVRHTPKPGADPGDVNLLVTYTDATADDSPNRVPPGELSIPLLRRLIGEPTMVASPGRIQFGAVFIGDSVTQNIAVTNAGYGNIALDVATVESSSDDMKPGTLPVLALLPGEKVDIPIIFAPTTAKFVQATLTLKSSDPAIKPAQVIAVATSLTGAKAAADPLVVDFGEVAKKVQKTAVVQLVNQGGGDLDLSNLAVGNDPGNNLVATLPGGVLKLTLAPLEAVQLTVQLLSATAGELDAVVSFKTNDSARTLQIPVKGLVTEAQITPTPAALDFGKVFKGWTKTQPITLDNTGFGDLMVTGITLVHGTSDLFALRTLPDLPATLQRGGRLALEVEFRADATADFTGAVSVESTDPNTGFLQIPLKATGTTCGLACAVPHAVPSCDSGTCAIDLCTADAQCGTLKCHSGKCCEAGWYDTNGTVEDGCECNVSEDPGPFCADAKNLGQMSDSHDSASFLGALPYPGDVNTLRFSSDGHGWFGSHTIAASFSSADPNLSMCVTRRAGGDCPTDQDSTSCGAYFSTSDEDTTFLVKVTRKTGAPPTCTPFTVVVSHY